jgi:hypothetical protein
LIQEAMFNAGASEREANLETVEEKIPTPLMEYPYSLT